MGSNHALRNRIDLLKQVSAQLPCLLNAGFLKRYLVANARPAEGGQIRRNNGRDLGIASRRLPVGHENDRSPVSGHLNRTQRDSVRYDIVAGYVFELWAIEVHGHPIRRRTDGVFAVQERLDRSLREARVLRPKNDTEVGRPCEIQSLKPKGILFAGGAPANRQCIARNQRAALPPSDMAADIGRNATEDWFDIESAFDRQIDNRPSGRRAYTNDLSALARKLCIDE